MKKYFFTSLGFILTSVMGFSQSNLDSINRENKKYIINTLKLSRVFNKERYSDYCISNEVYKEKGCNLSIYDFDRDGIPDAKARFNFPEDNFHNAMLIVLNEEDFRDPVVYISTNKHSEGFLNRVMSYKEYLDFYNEILQRKSGKDIVKLKKLESKLGEVKLR